MSLQSKIEFIHKLDDPEKLGATLKIIMESENEEVIERANELWMLLVLIHGDLLIQKFNEIDTGRKADDDYNEKLQRLFHESKIAQTKYDQIMEEDKKRYFEDARYKAYK